MAFKRAKELYEIDTTIKEATRKDKKYMILDNNTSQYVHFGSLNNMDLIWFRNC